MAPTKAHTDLKAVTDYGAAMLSSQTRSAAFKIAKGQRRNVFGTTNPNTTGAYDRMPTGDISATSEGRQTVKSIIRHANKQAKRGNNRDAELLTPRMRNRHNITPHTEHQFRGLGTLLGTKQGKRVFDAPSWGGGEKRGKLDTKSIHHVVQANNNSRKRKLTMNVHPRQKERWKKEQVRLAKVRGETSKGHFGPEGVASIMWVKPQSKRRVQRLNLSITPTQRDRKTVFGSTRDTITPHERRKGGVTPKEVEDATAMAYADDISSISGAHIRHVSPKNTKVITPKGNLPIIDFFRQELKDRRAGRKKPFRRPLPESREELIVTLVESYKTTLKLARIARKKEEKKKIKELNLASRGASGEWAPKIVKKASKIRS